MAVGSQAPAVTNPTWLSAATVGQEEHQRMGEVVVGHDVWGKGRASGAAAGDGGGGPCLRILSMYLVQVQANLASIVRVHG